MCLKVKMDRILKAKLQVWNKGNDFDPLVKLVSKLSLKYS